MSKTEITEKTQEVIQHLYQNKAKTAVEGVAELLTIYQSMLECFVKKGNSYSLQTLNMLKELVENYNHLDVIGMADCLQKNAYDIIEAYFAE